MPDDAKSRSSDVNAPGGVMTDEAGVITGELTLRSEVSGATVTLRVQYKDADEWYRLTGAPTALPPGQSLDDLHEQTVTSLRES
jgi:hypothetical protein